MNAKTKRIFRTFQAVALLTSIAFVSSKAAAKVSRGPYVAAQLRDQAEVKARGSAVGEVSDAHYEAFLAAPIPATWLGGMIFPLADLDLLDRQVEAAPRERLSNGAFGFGFLPHASEGAPAFFLVANRHGSLLFPKEVPPMVEIILGADFDEYPYFLKFRASDYTETRLALRLRRFPHGDRYLPLIEHTIRSVAGTALTIAVPSHIRFVYRASEDSRLFAQVDWESVQYAGAAGDEAAPFLLTSSRLLKDVWTEGYKETIELGARHRLFGILFLSLEVGLQRELWNVYSIDGKKVGRDFETDYSPWARLALETWIETP